MDLLFLATYNMQWFCISTPVTAHVYPYDLRHVYPYDLRHVYPYDSHLGYDIFHSPSCLFLSLTITVIAFLFSKEIGDAKERSNHFQHQLRLVSLTADVPKAVFLRDAYIFEMKSLIFRCDAPIGHLAKLPCGLKLYSFRAPDGRTTESMDINVRPATYWLAHSILAGFAVLWARPGYGPGVLDLFTLSTHVLMTTRFLLMKQGTSFQQQMFDGAPSPTGLWLLFSPEDHEIVAI
jgi:hypothetical protein